MNMLTFPSPKERLLPDQIICVAAPREHQDARILNKFKGSLVGLAVGDALGASVEFRPRQYLLDHPVFEMQSGGTWGLSAGKWTDDTSMALCLASSLISKKEFDPYDQLVRYKWWYKYGFLSSIGQCFDIGNATRNALELFSRRQFELQKRWPTVNEQQLDNLSYSDVKEAGFNVYCGAPNAGGNGALMRLAPVPLFFYRNPAKAVQLSGESARLTHGDPKAVDSCRYLAALIVAALHGESKQALLSSNFYTTHQQWFGSTPLNREVLDVAMGSFKVPDGYANGIRGSGQAVKALEAALWAFYNDDNSFEKGVLLAVNLGDDTDTIGAIYGQLAGTYYGCNDIPQRWREKLYANRLVECVAEWLCVLGSYSNTTRPSEQMIPQMLNPSTVISSGLTNFNHPNLTRVISNPTYSQPVVPSYATYGHTYSHGVRHPKPSHTGLYTTRTHNHPPSQNSSWSWYRHANS